jgi:hypothetical protein
MEATRCAVRMELQLALLLFKIRAFHHWGKVETYSDGLVVFSSTQDILRREVGDWQFC